MTAQEVIKTVAAMPEEDWIKIQCGIADLISSKFSREEIEDIGNALMESESEFKKGDGLTGPEMRKQLGLQ